jgi:hypothetical protein
MRGRLVSSDVQGTLVRMGIPFPQPQHVACSDCGAAVERSLLDEHVCDRDRLLDYQLFELRDEVAAVEGDLAAYLDSPAGRFELWYAERDRRTNA